MALRPSSPPSLGLLCGFQGQAADLPIFAPIFVSSNQVTEAEFARSGTGKFGLAARNPEKFRTSCAKPRLVWKKAGRRRSGVAVVSRRGCGTLDCCDRVGRRADRAG